MVNETEIISWLLESDPSIRWQVMKDLQKKDASLYSIERERLIENGWGSILLKLQDQNGLWNGRYYDGKWISTTYALYLLKLFGLPEYHIQALIACDKLFKRSVYNQKEFRFSRDQKHQDLGVTGMIVSLCCYFGYHQEQIHNIVEFLVNQQQKDGGWLSDLSNTAQKYSFETTLLILEGLLQYRIRYSTENKAGMDAESRGQEYLLQHHLYLEKGKVIKEGWTSFSFPPYWFYDVLTAIDYFRASGMQTDPRLQPAINLIEQKRDKEGKWFLGRRHPGKTFFDIEKPSTPSRWNTLRAMRVLNYWEKGDSRNTPA